MRFILEGNDAMPTNARPEMRVFDVFHRLVGRVTEVRPEVALAVRLQSGEIVWLGMDVVFTAEGDAVTLVCNQTQLDGYRWHEPLEPGEPHSRST
jgi:hypothetical protein